MASPVEMFGPSGLRDIEPHAVGCAALWSPSTSIIDYRAVARQPWQMTSGMRGQIQLGAEVTGITTRGETLVLAVGRLESWSPVT